MSGDQGMFDQEHLHYVASGPAQERQLETKQNNLSEEGPSLLINPKLLFW